MILSKKANNKDADQSAQMHRLVCIFIVGEPPKQVFSCLGPYFSCFRCLLLTFFQNLPFQNILSGTLSECQTVWIQIRTGILTVLIWVQTVCKIYQLMKKFATYFHVGYSTIKKMSHKTPLAGKVKGYSYVTAMPCEDSDFWPCNKGILSPAG